MPEITTVTGEPTADPAAAPSRPIAPADAKRPAWVHQTVYEDEYVRIEWSVKTPHTDTVAVTFDPIFVDPSKPAYANAFMHRAGVDTLCVRKKQEHFYQPLSRECFEAAAGPVLGLYRRRLAYGSSLGAYAVLYFCAHGFETVISSSPRVSAHPVFGRRHWQQRVAFQHEGFDPARPATSGAVIFYDPHDDMDRRFVDEHLRPAWPGARFVAVPYAGHPANQFLSEIGYISPFVSAIAAGKEPPALDRQGSKARSFTYRHRLAAACLAHAKPRWAEHLCLAALAMKPELTSVKLTLGQALMAQGRLDEAEPALLEFQAAYPQDGDVEHALRALSLERTRLRRRHWWPEQVAAWRQRARRVRQAAAGWPGRHEAVLLALTGALGLTVTRAQIGWCYRVLLGREPESEAALLAHRRCRSFNALLRAFMRSREYEERIAREPVLPNLELRVCLARLVYRLLPVGGRMRCLDSFGLLSPRICPPSASEAGHGEDPVTLVLRSKAVDAGSAAWTSLVPQLQRGLAPGGHALLVARSGPGAREPTQALHEAGFDRVECHAIAHSSPGLVVVLARRSLAPAAPRHPG